MYERAERELDAPAGATDSGAGREFLSGQGVSAVTVPKSPWLSSFGPAAK